MQKTSTMSSFVFYLIAFCFVFLSDPAISHAGPAQEALSCLGCHGMPPIDSESRDIFTGGFKGNHSTHNPPGVAPQAACEKCHPGSSRYSSGHRNGFIDMTSNINVSPHPAKATYGKPRFFNQTSIPVAANCSNVNCHFENSTPTWGSDPKTTTCSSCHDTPPTDGSHPRHGSFGCLKCHPDHSAETLPFIHATSVGKRSLLVQFVTTPNSGGTYSGSLNYPDYLPSRHPSRNGSCQNIYCHSDGRGGLPNASPVWSGALPQDCSGCHGSGATHGAPSYPNGGIGVSRANSHDKHVHGAADCEKCHVGTTTDGTSIKAGSSLHVNGAVDVTFDPGMAGEGATWTAETHTCSAILCHTDGTSVSTGNEQNAGGKIAWGGGGSSCNGCHGYPPSYANGLPKANTHASHNYSCNTCHAGTTADGTTISNSSLHGNHAYDVSPGAGVSFTYLFAATGGTCSNISCHNNGTAVWGSTLTCGGCHAVSPGGD